MFLALSAQSVLRKAVDLVVSQGGKSYRYEEKNDYFRSYETDQTKRMVVCYNYLDVMNKGVGCCHAGGKQTNSEKTYPSLLFINLNFPPKSKLFQ